MSLGRDTTFTWYGHACIEVRTPGGKTILIDPWFGNPRSTKAADAVAACDLGLVEGGVGGEQRFVVRLGARVEERGADADGGMNPVGAGGV